MVVVFIVIVVSGVLVFVMSVRIGYGESIVNDVGLVVLVMLWVLGVVGFVSVMGMGIFVVVIVIILVGFVFVRIILRVFIVSFVF